MNFLLILKVKEFGLPKKKDERLFNFWDEILSLENDFLEHLGDLNSEFNA